MYQDGQLVQNTVDGSRPGYQGTRQTSSQKKSTLYKKLLNDLPEGYLEDYKKIFLKDRGDGTFSLKPGDAPEGILDMEKKYGEIIKKMKTRQGEVKNITRKIGEMNSAIKQSLEKDKLIVSGLSDADAVRKADLKIVGEIDLKAIAPKGKVQHHFMPLAGVEGESMNLSSTKNTAFIDKKLNEKMSPHDKKLKKNQKEQIKLLDEKKPGWEGKIERLNYKAKNLYKDAGKKVPKSKGLLGYSQIEVKPGGTYDIKVTGIDPNKSFAGLEGEEIIYKNLSKADKSKLKKSLEAKIIESLKKNPKLAKEVQMSLNAGFNIDDILKSPAVKKGMPWIKGDLYFAAVDVLNNWTKGQSFKKGALKGIETGTFGLVDFNADEKALVDYAERQGLSKKEVDAMRNYLYYMKEKKNNDIFRHRLKFREDNQGDSTQIADYGEQIFSDKDVARAKDKVTQSDTKLQELTDKYFETSFDGSEGAMVLQNMMEGLTAEEWNKPAGTMFDRGKRLDQGSGTFWDMFNIPFSKPKDTVDYLNPLKEKPKQELMIKHPVYGYKEQIKRMEKGGKDFFGVERKPVFPMEDINYSMDYALPKAEGGIMNLRRKNMKKP